MTTHIHILVLMLPKIRTFILIVPVSISFCSLLDMTIFLSTVLVTAWKHVALLDFTQFLNVTLLSSFVSTGTV